MVDNTREAFGLNIDDTPFFSRPVDAAREDTFIRENEDGSRTFRDIRNREYTVYPTQPTPRPEGGYIRAAGRAIADTYNQRLTPEEFGNAVADAVQNFSPSRVGRGLMSAGSAALDAFQTTFEEPRGPAGILFGTATPTMGLAFDVAGTGATGSVVGTVGRTRRAASAPTESVEPPAMTLAQQTEEALPAPTPVAAPTPSVVETPPAAAPEVARAPQPRPAARIEVPRYMQASPEVEPSLSPIQLKGHHAEVASSTVGSRYPFLTNPDSDSYVPNLANVTVNDLALVSAGWLDEGALYRKYNIPFSPHVGNITNRIMNELEELPTFRYIRDRSIQPTEFNSPITEVLNTMPVPSKGIKGSEFIKALKANPTVRTTHVNSLESNIDPARRYTREELAGLTESRAQVQVLEGQSSRYQQFQRQHDLNHPEDGYFELVIDYDGPQGIPRIAGIEQHYNPNTLAHTRASIRRDETGQQYILAEEWQSDLLQKGYAKPVVVTRQQQQKYLDNKKDEYTPRDRTQDTQDANRPTIAETFDIDDLIPDDDAWVPDTLFSSPLTSSQYREITDVLDTLTLDDIISIRTKAGYDSIMDTGWYLRDHIMSNYPDLAMRTGIDALDSVTNIVRDMPMSRPAPPITKTEEATRLVMDSLIAEASRRGINRIVLTPYDKILEKRASDLAATYGKKLKRNVTPQEAIEMAKQPKSGMYDTYVRSTQRVLEDLPEGAVVRERMLPYTSDALADHPAVTNLFMTEGVQASNSLQDAVVLASDIIEDNFLGLATADRTRAVTRFIQHLENTVPGFQATDDVMESGASFMNAIRPLLQPKTLPAIEIDITDLLQQGLDLQRPRFNQGGLVDANTEAQTNELFNAVPPETEVGFPRKTNRITNSGRPLWEDETGELYSEKTVTFPVGDRWITFPSVDAQGREMSEDEVFEYVMQNGPVDPITGEVFPVFYTLEEAESFAVSRSDRLLDGLGFSRGGYARSSLSSTSPQIITPETTMSPARAAHKAWMQRTMQNLTANARRM